MVRNVELAEIFNDVALKFVPVAEVNVKLEKKALVDVTLVPVAVVKPKAPESVPPDNSR